MKKLLSTVFLVCYSGVYLLCQIGAYHMSTQKKIKNVKGERTTLHVEDSGVVVSETVSVGLVASLVPPLIDLVSKLNKAAVAKKQKEYVAEYSGRTTFDLQGQNIITNLKKLTLIREIAIESNGKLTWSEVMKIVLVPNLVNESNIVRYRVETIEVNGTKAKLTATDKYIDLALEIELVYYDETKKVFTKSKSDPILISALTKSGYKYVKSEFPHYYSDYLPASKYNVGANIKVVETNSNKVSIDLLIEDADSSLSSAGAFAKEIIPIFITKDEAEGMETKEEDKEDPN